MSVTPHQFKSGRHDLFYNPREKLHHKHLVIEQMNNVFYNPIISKPYKVEERRHRKNELVEKFLYQLSHKIPRKQNPRKNQIF